MVTPPPAHDAAAIARAGFADHIKCDACAARLAPGDKYRTDGDGFTGCLPCFPISNFATDADRFMRGSCYSKREAVRC